MSGPIYAWYLTKHIKFHRQNWKELGSKNIKQFFPPSSAAETDSDEDPGSQDKADVGRKGARAKPFAKRGPSLKPNLNLRRKKG